MSFLADPDFSHALQDFITHLKASGRSSSTICCYLHDLKLLEKIIGNLRLSHITGSPLEKAVIRLCDCPANGKARSATTVNRIKSAFRSFFKWAFESGRASRNAAARLYPARTKPRHTMPINMNEIKCLLDTIQKSDDPLAKRDEALFATYAFTGIRRSEALSLRISDYDRVSSTLFIRQTKNGNSRIQPVPFQLSEILNEYIRYIKCAFRLEDYSPLFFGRYPEKPLSARQAQMRFEKWKNLAGIRKSITIHSFRAGFATLLYETTGDILLVSRAMGHADIQTTKRYIQDNTPGIKEAVEKTFHSFS